MPHNIRPIDSTRPDRKLIKEAVRIMQKGGVIVFPTSGLYGLGTDATNSAAVDRIFEIKQRVSSKPILILIRSENHLDRWVKDVSPAAVIIIDHHWPGGVTLVLKAKSTLPANLTANTGKIGVRRPAHPVAKALVDCADFPITATSANLAGQTGCAAVKDLPAAIIDRTDMVLDADALSIGIGSTVVDVTGAKPLILREGRVPAATILNAM